MPIESGPYCSYRRDASGNLQDFDTRFAGTTAWVAERDPSADRADIEARTLQHMATMPAWVHHPRVAGRTSSA